MSLISSARIRECRWLAGLQVAGALLVPLLWFFHRLPPSRDVFHLTWHPAWLVLPLGAAIARFVLREQAKDSGRPLPKPGPGERAAGKATLALLAPFAAVWAAEGGLAVADFERELPPVLYESPEIGEDTQERVLSHPVYLFTFNPGTVYNKVRINSMGFREREVDPEKKPGTARVICFGDSITAQGRPNYSGILHELLRRDPPDSREWEAFNMGVYGYSSRQGLALFRGRGKALAPDFITVYFGPNDRNLYPVTDRERMARVKGGLAGRVLNAFQKKRLGKWVMGMATDRALRRAKREAAVEDKVPRVPPEDYRHVMRRFVIEAREIGAEAILITAPRRELSLGLVSAGHAVSLEAATERHDAYNEIVREVARELDAPLLDLAAEMAGPEFDGMFADDGVHFDHYATEHLRKPESQPGLQTIARRLHDMLVELTSTRDARGE